MILCFSFSFSEGEDVHSMVMDEKHEVFEDFMKRIYCNSDGSCPGIFSPPSEEEGIHFITSEWGVVKINFDRDESLTQSWLNEQLHRVISLWAKPKGPPNTITIGKIFGSSFGKNQKTQRHEGPSNF